MSRDIGISISAFLLLYKNGDWDIHIFLNKLRHSVLPTTPSPHVEPLNYVMITCHIYILKNWYCTVWSNLHFWKQLTIKATSVSETAWPFEAHSWAISRIMFFITLSACARDILFVQYIWKKTTYYLIL